MLCNLPCHILEDIFSIHNSMLITPDVTIIIDHFFSFCLLTFRMPVPPCFYLYHRCTGSIGIEGEITLPMLSSFLYQGGHAGFYLLCLLWHPLGHTPNPHFF